jgi:GNAT superfamily N-acetyltransferase
MLRAATRHDAKALARIHVESWRLAYRSLMPDQALERLDVKERIEQWRAWLGEPGHEVWVAEVEGEMVGFATLAASLDDDAASRGTAEIPALYLLPGYWRQGHGRALFGRALERARERGFSELTVWVLGSNDRARRFYEAMGLHADGGRKVDTRLAEAPLVSVRYRIRIR